MLLVIDTGSFPSFVDCSPFKSKNPVMSSSFTDLVCSDAWNQNYTPSPSWLFDFLINQVFSLVVEIDIFFVHKSDVKSTHNSLYLSTIPAIYWIIVSMLGNLNFITFFIVLVKPINPLTHSFKKATQAPLITNEILIHKPRIIRYGNMIFWKESIFVGDR